jgi:serine/threonine-protein kinase
MDLGSSTSPVPIESPARRAAAGVAGAPPWQVARPEVSEENTHLASTQLLSYHEVLGSPTPSRVPGEPVEGFEWLARYRIVRLLGSGAQGVVYLAHREGADGYSTRVAVKLYPRDESTDEGVYQSEMRRIARQAELISEIQHDNVVNIRDFVSIGDTRLMVMEWIDGVDLRQLLDHRRYDEMRGRVSRRDWDRLNDVVVTRGEDHCRLKPGVAVAVLRGCLAGLAGLHQHGIVHSDLKPANIMIKRTGAQKLIDMDSSCPPNNQGTAVIRGTPYYMAPEQLKDHHVGFRSDVASLGYILLEMLTGRQIFKRCRTIEDLLDAKRVLPLVLPELLPQELESDPNLVGLCAKMVAFDPETRFPDADAADIGQLGAASFHRELVKHDLSTDYDRELAWWNDFAAPVGGE